MVIGTPQESEKLEAALRQLGATNAGAPIARALYVRGTRIKFGLTDDDAIAQFDPYTNEITIHVSQKDASPAVLAAYLAHEGAHVQWNKPDSIEQEYHAFKAEADIWNQLKGDETDEQCDWVNSMIDLGEADAKREIRKRYPGLPEYQSPGVREANVHERIQKPCPVYESQSQVRFLLPLSQ
jgi:hypothetical protein